jgi:hypothetical protein
MEFQRTFLAGRMNKDLDERLVPDGEYRDAVNVTIDTSEGSNIGAVQNTLGNTITTNITTILSPYQVAAPLNAVTIGAISVEAENLLYWFVKADNFEGIFEYNQVTNTSLLVLGTTTNQLGFDKNHLITGVNYVTDGNGGGLLIWNDNLNPPRRINISRCKTYSVNDPRINDDINLIIAPPLNSPFISLNTISTPNLEPNNIEDKFVYFSYRYKYVDNEYSSMSPFSAVSFDPKTLQIDTETGDNKGMLNKFNQVEVTFETGNEFVTEIQLLVWESRTLNVKIVETLNKEEIGISDNSTYSFNFMNNKTYAALPSDQVTRLFDNVPLKALSQDIIGSRLIMGNYTQFRDLLTDINYTVDYTSDIITSEPKQTWRSDRDYEIGIAYLDDYGRMTTVLTTTTDNTNNNLSNSVYIPPTNSSTANSLVVNIKNKAPEWATGYRFFVKQSKTEYYNIFPVTYLVSGSYRYFLINESDRDKIKVNGYIIFKSSGSGPTNSNKQFKVLELEQKAANAINIGSLEGLYFKIKADTFDTFISATNQSVFNFNGSGRGPKILGFGSNTINPVADRTTNANIASTLAYYHFSGDNTIQNTGPTINMTNINCQTDARLTVLITPGNKYKTTLNLDQSSFSAESNITTTPVVVTIATGQTAILNFQSGTYTPGDRFVFNVRGQGNRSGTPSARNNNNYGLPTNINSFGINEYGGVVLLQEPTGGGIYPGAQIVIDIEYDCAPGDGYRAQINSFTSPGYYVNLEEWFYESGAYSSFVQWKDENSTNNIGSRGVTFRNGITYLNTGSPVSNSITQVPFAVAGSSLYMCIQGFGNGSLIGTQKNEIKASLKVTQTPLSNRLTAETVPANDDVDIFYEMSRTYPVDVNGNHMTLWNYDRCVAIGSTLRLIQDDKTQPHYFKDGQQVYITAANIPAAFYTITGIPNRYTIQINYTTSTATIPGGVSDNNIDKNQSGALNQAVVKLNNPNNKNSDYNAYCYGNGVESNRILDGFNEPWLKYSLRASGVIEDYEQQIKDTSVTYSGLYRWDSSINRLNEFNLSLANFKNLDKNFGTVQKLYARTTDLVVLHQDKITSVLYGKNLLVDAVGGGSVASVPEVLGTQIALPYEFGISSNPESFAVWSDRMYFSDAKRGVVLQMQGDQVMQISRMGMSDYFRDLMASAPNTAKLGAYDPYNHNYVIASTDRRNVPCDIQINPSADSFPYNTAGSLQYLFALSGTTSWSITLINNGFGTNWIELPPYCQTGVGAQDIYARIQNNITLSNRSVIVRVAYCNTYVDYTLTQGRTRKIDFNILTLGTDE